MCSCDRKDVSGLHLGPVQMYSDKMEASFKFDARFACSARMMCLNLTTEQSRYFINEGHTLLGFLPVGSRKVEKEGEDAGVKMDVSRHEPTSMEIVPLETAISHTNFSSSQKKQIDVLSRAALSPL